MKVKVEQEVESYHFEFRFDGSVTVYTAIILSDCQKGNEVLVHWRNDGESKLSNAYYSKESVERNIKQGLWINIKALDLVK